MNRYVQMDKVCNKATKFCLKTKLNRKEKVRNFWLHSVIFFTKFEWYNTAFQSLFSEIIRIWNYFFGRLEANFVSNSYNYN